MQSAAPSTVFESEILDQRDGIISFRAKGARAQEAFANEAGGHRFQRVPPTEKRGRVHTSTVTVAVLPEPEEVDLALSSTELSYQTCRGSGPGGQHRNKTESAVVLTHLPTGTRVRVDGGRSQHQNKEQALRLLRAKLYEERNREVEQRREADRRAQMGRGERGDKRRTIRFQDGVVIDHILDRRFPLRNYLRGEWE